LPKKVYDLVKSESELIGFLCDVTNSLTELTAFLAELPRIPADFVVLPGELAMSVRNIVKKP